MSFLLRALFSPSLLTVHILIPECWDEKLDDVLDGDFPLMLRHRLHCRIERSVEGEEEAGDLRGSPPMEDIIVMNEVVIDRGMSPFLTNIECYCDGVFVTAVQGDGIIISTPTGSTAYSVAAGGSMVHPQVPGMLFTPICPHSLSFRPLIFPDTVTLSVQMQEGSRNANCWCSFDGKERMQLSEGDRLVISLARAPIPIICNRVCSLASTNTTTIYRRHCCRCRKEGSGEALSYSQRTCML